MQRSLVQDIDVPAQYRTRSFLALRNEWYRRLEREGVEVDEPGFVPRRERKRKGPQLGNPVRYGNPQFEPEVDLEAAERVNAERFGGPRACWNLENAEFWQLMAEQVEALPWSYFGKTFLRRWAEIGDIKTAAADTGVPRWRARQIHERFVELLKRKRVLR
jgi:hypothetical protein